MIKCINKSSKEFINFSELAKNESIAKTVWLYLDGKVDHITSAEEIYAIYPEAAQALLDETTIAAEMRDTTSSQPLAKFTKEQRSEIVDNIIFLAAWDGDKQQLVEDLETGLKISNIGDILTNQMLSVSSVYKPNYEELLKEENLEAIKTEVTRKLARLGATLDEDEDPDNKNEGAAFTDSYLIKNLDRARVSTKLMVGFLVDENIGNVLGIKKFNDFNKSWSDLEEILSGVANDINQPDKYKVFKDILQGQIKIKPQYEFLITLLENSSEQKRTQFVRSLDNFKIEYLNETISDADKGYEVKRMSSESFTSASKVLNLWNNNYLKLYISKDKKGNPLVNTTLAKKVLANYTKISEIVQKSDEVNQELIDWTLALLKTIGINMDTTSLTAYLDSSDNSRIEALKNLYSNNGIQYVFSNNSINSISKLANNESVELDDDNNIKSPIVDEKNIKKIAELQSRFENNLVTNSMLGPEGKMYQTISQYDYMGKNITNIINDKNYLYSLDSDFTKGSRFLDHLKEGDNHKNLKLQYFLSRRYEGKDAGVDMNGMSEVDESVSRIERVLNGQLPYFTLADKNRVYYIDGLPTMKFRTSGLNYYKKVGNKNEKVDGVLDFVKYLAVELNTMSKAWDEVYGENPIPENKQILNYHYKINKKGERVKGNAFTLSTFPSLNPGTELAKELGLYDTNGKPFPIATSYLNDEGDAVESGFVPLVYDEVKKVLQQRINSATKRMMSDLITIKNGKVEHHSFSTDTYKEYIEGAFSIEEGVKTIATNFIMNTLSANIEFAKMFTGDPRMYKSIDDYLKRIPATSATGDYLRIVEGKINETFNIAVLQNFDLKSELTEDSNIDAIAEFIKDTSKEAKERIRNIVNPYSRVNRTDAQGWITMARFKEIMNGLGEWNDKLDAAYDNIVVKKNGTLEDYELFSKKMTTLQPKKGVHFELVNDGYGNLVPVYLKYSQAILFPEFVSSSYQLTRITEQMEAQGVSELIVGDGVKVGAIEPTDLGTNRTDLIKFNTITLSNKNWKLQQDLPSKGNKDTLVGSQIKKNIIANIILDETYGDMSGEELINAIHDMDSELSNKGLSEILNKFDAKDGKINNDALYEMLIKEFKNDGESANLIKALEDRVPIDNLLSHRQVIWNKISAIWNKSTVKIKQPGGAAIQISDYGFESGEDIVKYESIKNKDKKGIVWLTNNRKLKPPRVIYSNAKGDKLEIDQYNELSKDQQSEYQIVFSGGQALLPYNKLAAAFGEKKWNKIKKLPLEELKKYIDSDVLKMVGYRIPNQELASNDSLEIVGILPPHAGDSIVLYSEITSKTGSDFDIDKMYYILPAIKFNKDSNKLETVKYLDDSNSTVEERYTLVKEKALRTKKVKELFDEFKLDIYDASILNDILENSNLKDTMLSELGIDDSEQIFELLQEEGDVPTFEEFSKLPIIKQNSKEALQTRRIDLYRKVLESNNSYLNLISTVDAEWLKDQIDIMLPPKSLTDLELYDGLYQMDNRREFITSKGGVGQVANHQGDNAISQYAKLFIRDNSGRIDIGNLTSDNQLDLSQLYSSNFEVVKKTNSGYTIDNSNEKILISKSISAYMNAFVDAAKDNYIGRANFNFNTNNSAFLLIRNGVSPQYVNALLAQPAIRRYVALINKKEGQAVEINTKKPLDIVLEELGVKKSDYTSMDNVKLSDFSTKNLMDMVISDNKGELISNVDQAKLLNLFLHVQSVSKTLNKQAKASKADTEGNGGNLGSAYIKHNQKLNISNLKEDGYLTVGNWDKKFDNTMLYTYHKNSIESMIEHLGPLSLLGTTKMQNALNKMYLSIYGELPSDGDKYNKLYQMTYAAILAKSPMFNKGLSNETKDGLVDIMKGSNSVANRVLKLQNNYEYDNNLLISMLAVRLGYKGSPDFTYLDNSKSRNKEVNEGITEDWLELYNSNNEEDKKLAKDLVLYAFYTSALTDNLSSIYRLIPYEISRDMGMTSEYHNELKSALNEPTAKDSLYLKSFETVMQNLASDTNIVPKVSKKSVQRIGDFKTDFDKSVVFAVDSESSPSLYLGVDEKLKPVFKPYVTRDIYYRDNFGRSFKNTFLYKYIGNSNDERGVYKRIPMLGNVSKTNKLFEFSSGNSIFPSNNFKMSNDYSNKLNKIYTELPGEVYQKGEQNISESLQESEKISSFEETESTGPSYSEYVNLAGEEAMSESDWDSLSKEEKENIIECKSKK